MGGDNPLPHLTPSVLRPLDPDTQDIFWTTVKLFSSFLCLNIQAPAPVCISAQLIVIKLCSRVVSYSVYYTTSTR